MALIRWTIGPVSKCGFEILRESVSRFQDVYPDVRRVVCYNGVSPELLQGIDAELVDQTLFSTSLSFPPSGPAWPLYPPRISLDEHEMFVDNDVVIYRNVSEIDQFLDSEDIVFFSEGTRRRYGNYDHLVPPSIKINSGLFGIPPGFPFLSKIEHALGLNKLGRHEHHHDFQGIVASSLVDFPFTLQIKTSTITLCEPEQEISCGESGIHFVVANQCSDRVHKPWEQYKLSRLVL